MFETNIDEAISLLNGGPINVLNFGQVNYYDIKDIIDTKINITVEKILGIRTFWGLQQNNEIKNNLEWQIKCLILKCGYLI